MEFNHISVLLKESIDFLNIKPEGFYVDGTLGGGGHSEQILQMLQTGKLIAFDRDKDAIEAAEKRLAQYKDKLIIVHDNFRNLKENLEILKIDKVDGIILDLGVSSYQLDTAERGFSYSYDAPLDMRMNEEDEFSAYNVVNEYTKEELANVIYKYGEEKWAKRIAEFIVERRPLNTTFELVEAITAAVPKSARKSGPHPAKRTFQAIRIEVNKELEGLKEDLCSMAECLNEGGRFSVITFHSLEDRIVKEAFRKLENPCECPPEFPVCVCGKKPIAKVITRKPVLPSKEEIEKNPRSRSAKLRVAEKI
ncbi:MAG: 16S rRNA (cytosine(1402)-N(4))-methyltransferase RsmH [Firmicutes bacterium]|nr:16S rRNA (cytosine(1402)-N(4))-methyltransferase RsmH [Bacillota bacterium]